MIYLDNAATTKVNNQVLQEMLPYFTESYGNPSASHYFGVEAKRAVEKARSYCAELINAQPEEIYFTSGGTESNNTALFSVPGGSSVITSMTEHHAVLNPCKRLEEAGCNVAYLKPDSEGVISPDDVEKAINSDTSMVSIMTANNEIGTIAPVSDIGKICREKKVLFHTDAVQAFGHIPIDVKEMNIDLLSASGHKLGAPKGVGLLYVRKDVKIPPLLLGGGQERGFRSGTLNVPSIVGLGEAARLAKINMEKNYRKECDLRDHLISRVLGEVSGVRLNGSPKNRLPGNANFTIADVDGAELMQLLAGDGIIISTGSACSSSDSKPSHVLTAIGLTETEAGSSIRITLNHENTMDEIDEAVDKMKSFVEALTLIN
jgi:cysteine desulfurase